jgi:hypothetical protein
MTGAVAPHRITSRAISGPLGTAGVNVPPEIVACCPVRFAVTLGVKSGVVSA